MTYNKPEVVKLDRAVIAIQGTMKGSPIYPDAVSPNPATTPGAYEADE